MESIPYICPVCGKELKNNSRGTIKLHERSNLHKAVMNKETKQANTIKPVPSIATETIQELNTTGIQTTVPEGNNDTNKDTSKGTRGQEGEPNEDSEEWDGYLC